MKRFVYLGIMILASCASPKDLVYQDVKNFRVNKISANPEVGLDVQFFNPNSYGMTLKDANVDFYINHKMVGKATLEKTFNIQGNSTFLLPVNLTADLSSVMNNALALIANDSVLVTLNGNVKAGKGVFVNVPINYEGKKKLNLF